MQASIIDMVSIYTHKFNKQKGFTFVKYLIINIIKEQINPMLRISCVIACSMITFLLVRIIIGCFCCFLRKLVNEFNDEC